MSSKWLAVIACGVLGLASAARAEFSATPALVSDYDFRGITQTGKDPAAQLGLEYQHDATGLYAGLWGSNIRFTSGDPHFEVDASAGWRRGDGESVPAWDFGVTRYTFHEADDSDFNEFYAGVDFRAFAGRAFFAPRFNATSESAWYLSAAATLPLPHQFAVQFHAGYSGGDYWDRYYGDGYFDWSVTASRPLGRALIEVGYVDGSDLADGDDGGCTTACDFFSTDGRLIARISTTLPWKAD